MAGIPEWLDLLRQAAQLESTAGGGTEKVIQPFVEGRAGQEWVQSRARAALEDVKQLVLGGWGGWDGMEVKREREVSVLVEVEEDEPTATAIGSGKEKTEAVEVDGDEDGWGLDSPIASTHPDIPALPRKEEGTAADPVVVDAEEDAWGFDDDDKSKSESVSTKARAEIPVSTAKADADEPDGWEFDLDSSKPAAAASATTKPAKPVREAKKLGKKVARAKQAEADAMADADIRVEDEQMPSGMSGMSTPASSSEVHSGQDGDGWGWDEPAAVAPEDVARDTSQGKVVEKQASARRMITRQEKRVVEESYLVSKACEKLLGLVGRCLAESRELESSS
jgi:centromere/kinetochore protein ZW10